MRRSGGRGRGRGGKVKGGGGLLPSKKSCCGGWVGGGMEGITERVLINQTFSILGWFDV